MPFLQLLETGVNSGFYTILPRYFVKNTVTRMFFAARFTYTTVYYLKL